MSMSVLSQKIATVSATAAYPVAPARKPQIRLLPLRPMRYNSL